MLFDLVVVGGGPVGASLARAAHGMRVALVSHERRDEARLWAINVDGVLWGIQAAVAKFKELGRPGKIINASSIAGHEGFAMLGPYSATKFAVRALTQAAAKEHAADGIVGHLTLKALAAGAEPVQPDIHRRVAARRPANAGSAGGEVRQRAVERPAGRGLEGGRLGNRQRVGPEALPDDGDRVFARGTSVSAFCTCGSHASVRRRASCSPNTCRSPRATSSMIFTKSGSR